MLKREINRTVPFILIIGGAGNDSIHGEYGGFHWSTPRSFHLLRGDDTIDGGEGNDILNGGKVIEVGL